jgi:hypothetical protein
MAANVNFALTHDPSFIRTCSPYTCDPGTPIRDGRRAVESLGSISALEDVNRIRDFIAKTEFRPLIYPLLSGPQIRHPPERPSARKLIREKKAFKPTRAFQPALDFSLSRMSLRDRTEEDDQHPEKTDYYSTSV